MYRYVGHVVSAIEKSDLDQVLSRKRLCSRWGPPLCGARRASPCSSLSTLPGGGLGRARVVSRQRVVSVFVFFVKLSKRLFVRIGRYQSRSMYTTNILG